MIKNNSSTSSRLILAKCTVAFRNIPWSQSSHFLNKSSKEGVIKHKHRFTKQSTCWVGPKNVYQKLNHTLLDYSICNEDFTLAQSAAFWPLQWWQKFVAEYNNCNLQIEIQYFVLIIFHNLKGCDTHIIIINTLIFDDSQIRPLILVSLCLLACTSWKYPKRQYIAFTIMSNL